VFTDPDGVSDPTTYTYDPLGRLTVAELSDQTLTYGFGEVTGCSGVNNEPSAGLNGNRTSQTRTVDGVSTTDIYCYDTGDRLTSASQVNGSVVYDAHGNVTQLGDTSFTYDSLDRHVSTVLPTGQTVSLVRDIDGSVLTRTVIAPNQPVEVVKYSVGVVQFYLNSNNQVTGTTQSLPGGVSVTDANSTSTTTFTSLQGNACLTVSAAGTTRTRFDPFGTPLTALPDTLPGSAEAGFGTVAGKLTDTLSAFGLIEMGARLYSTVLGRFLQVDPVPGGGVNAYSYPPDPVNMNDYSGETVESDVFWVTVGIALVIVCTGCTILGFAAIGAFTGFGAYYTGTSTKQRTVEGAAAAAAIGAIPIPVGIGVAKGATIALGKSARFGVNSTRFGNATIGVKHSPITQVRGRTYHGGTMNNKSLETRTGWRVFRGQTYFGRAIDSTPTVVNHHHFSPSVSVRRFE
jgi:RHS repeat-associated protein